MAGHVGKHGRVFRRDLHVGEEVNQTLAQHLGGIAFCWQGDDGVTQSLNRGRGAHLG